MNIVKKVNYRYNIVYKFLSPVLDDLLNLAKRFPPDNLNVFRKDYGRILGYLEASLNEYQRDVVHTLLQFYDHTLRCFIFPDYLLAHTLEEYSSILDNHILHQANIKKKVSVCGYHSSFLLQDVGGMVDKEDWKDFNAVLACCIYGIVLFLNEVKFIDENFVAIFIQRNIAPTLLGDLYHSRQSRSYKGKGGVVHYCAPLLYRWFRSHLPCQGAFVDTQDTLKWSQRLMGLTSKDTDWYKHSLRKSESKEVIFSCGELTNVPLMGMRCGINYNPTLSQRQLEYSLKDPPEDRDVHDSLFYDVPDSTGRMERVF
ncbi:uncharacterized protein LOC127103827 [Lathyrus oleraceus]|uniref:uncharacterized protein LOC127103827 n=1 Tax=Pisum sativum TaxID=3888 RepID=UPI0021CEFA25|nr:uncharacterized protein LOC127103827 [Pisum sativum]